MPRSTRLAGHTLPYEGRVKDNHGEFVAVGPAVCSCGATSEPLTSANARKRWHAEHKDNVRASQPED